MNSKMKYMSKTLTMGVLLAPLVLGSVVPVINDQSNLVYAGTTAQSTDSLVPDRELSTAIHTKLGIDQNIPLSKDDLAKLTDLGVIQKGVTSLEGLQYATNLTTLAVDFNPNLSDLTPLSDLHKLTSLHASNTGISNVKPLASLTNLTDLDLNTTEVKDMSQLATLTGLTKLDVSFNRVVNAKPLEVLTNLNTLSIYGMGTQDMSSLGNLVKSIKTVYSSISSIISFESAKTFSYVTGDKTITVKNQAKNADGTPIPLDTTNANNQALHATYNASDDTVTFEVSSNPTYAFLKFKGPLSTSQAGDVETLTNYILKATEGNLAEVKTTNKYTVEDTDGTVLKTIDPVQYRVGDVPQFDASIFNIGGYTIDTKQSRYRDNITDSTLDELMAKYKVSSVSGLISAMNVKQTEISSTQAESTPTFKLVFAKDSTAHVEGGVVTVKYQDENGKTLAGSKKLNGNVGDDYVTNNPVIAGYHLVAQPDNVTGKFITIEQSVTYIYAKDQAKNGKDVTVSYIDENGKALAKDTLLSGKIGEHYTSESIAIDGYKLKTTPNNASGKFTDKAQSVTYIYKTASVPVKTNVVYRLYNPNTGEHLYSTSKYERDETIKAGWRNEGALETAPTSGKAVYRLYNPNIKGGDHYYTLSKYEATQLISKGWKWDNQGKAVFYSGGTKKVYVAYNPSAQSGAHNYTMSSFEENSLLNSGWKYGATAWYAVK